MRTGFRNRQCARRKAAQWVYERKEENKLSKSARDRLAVLVVLLIPWSLISWAMETYSGSV